jgi:membrane fusion protein, multidrug efflux system
LNTLKADQELLQAQIIKTEVRAPFNGVIGLRTQSEGAFINSSTVLASLQQLDPIKIEFAVPEKYVSELKKGTEINFYFQNSDKPYIAKVYALESRIDYTTRSLKARALCQNPNNLLIPGSFVKVVILLQSIKEALLVPAQAVIPILDGQMVFICKKGLAKSVKVEIGIRGDNEVQVTKGLNANDTLILTGLMQLKDGMALKPRIKKNK